LIIRIIRIIDLIDPWNTLCAPGSQPRRLIRSALRDETGAAALTKVARKLPLDLAPRSS
jgi:hypothetical protein